MRFADKLFYEQLEWDSKQLDLKCGKIGFRGISPDINQYELADNILQIIGENRDADFITIKIPGDLPKVLDCLLRKSVRFIGTELVYKFDHTLDVENQHDVNFFDSFDPDIFIPLADEMIFSRFYRDDNIPLDKVRKLWSDSIRNYCMGRADRIAVVYLQAQPAGMATINFVNNENITLYVVGVLKQFQGNGLGCSLMSRITREYGDKYKIFVETESTNKRAQRLYQKSGFILDSMRYTLHVWTGKHESKVAD
jgi:ribosomal protein S18 acetylase RimI-like enzyme